MRKYCPSEKDLWGSVAVSHTGQRQNFRTLRHTHLEEALLFRRGDLLSDLDRDRLLELDRLREYDLPEIF